MNQDSTFRPLNKGRKAAPLPETESAFHWQAPLLTSPRRVGQKKSHKRPRPRKKVDGHQHHPVVIESASGPKGHTTVSEESNETLTSQKLEKFPQDNTSSIDLQQPSPRNALSKERKAERIVMTESTRAPEMQAFSDKVSSEPPNMNHPSAWNYTEDEWTKVKSRPFASKLAERRRTLHAAPVSKTFLHLTESFRVLRRP